MHTHTYPTYDTYKASGVDWLGDVPEEWKLSRIATFFKERRSKVSDTDFPPLSVTKLGIFPQWAHVAKSNDNDNRKLVRKGDFVINSRSDRKGSSGLAKQDGSVSLINIVLEPNNIEPKFSEYLFKSFIFIEEFYRVGHGIVADLWTTRFDDIKNSLIAIPSLQTQIAIANFLDEKTVHIDQAIALKQQQIDTLNEYKQIVIQKAVTKGLNPHAPMKASGVEWIGDIPEHWEVKKLKFVADEISIKVDCNETTLSYVGMENIESKTGRLINNFSQAEGLANHFVKNNVLFGKLRPYLAKAYKAEFEGVCSTEFMVFKSSEFIHDDYFLFFLLSDKFIETINSSTYGSKMPRANPNFVKNQNVLLPPIQEQQAIIDYIESTNKKIDQTIDTSKQQIARLQEYKTILINEAVTGKIRVEE